MRSTLPSRSPTTVLSWQSPIRMRATLKAYAGTLESRSESVWEAGGVAGSDHPGEARRHRRSRGRATAARELARAPPGARRRGGRGSGTSTSALRSSPAATSRGWRRCAAGPTASTRCSSSSSRTPSRHPRRSGCAAWAGDGAVRLLDHDPDRLGAADRALPARARPRRRAAAPLAAAAVGRGDRRPPARGAAARRGSRPWRTCCAPWADEVEAQLERTPGARPGPRPPGARRRCASGPPPAEHPVLLHGDLNPTNVLAAEREPWLAIDPKPMVGDPAYDGPRLVTQPDPLTHRRSRRTLVAGASTIVADVIGRRPRRARGVVPRRRGRDGGVGPIARRRRDDGERVRRPRRRCSRRTCRDRRAVADLVGSRPTRTGCARALERLVDGTPSWSRARRSTPWPSRSSPCWRPAAAWRACSSTDAGALAMLRPDAPRAIRPRPALGELVTWKRRELLRIAARDLTGVDDRRGHHRRPRRPWPPTCSACVVDTAGDDLEPRRSPGRHRHGEARRGRAQLRQRRRPRARRRRRHRAPRARRPAPSLDRAGRGLPGRHRPPTGGPRRPARPHASRPTRPTGSGGRSRGSARRSSRRARWPATATLGEAWAAAAGRVLWDEPFGADDLRHVRALKVRAEEEAGAAATASAT